MSYSKIILVGLIIGMIMWLYFAMDKNEKYETVGNMSKKSTCLANFPNENITKDMIDEGHVESCPKSIQTADQFNRDFFKFRNKIENNSSQHYDTVDKINDMYLSGNIWNMGSGKTVAEIYDNLTCDIRRSKEYTRQCVRLPSLDGAMHDNYDSKMVTGLYQQGREWVYKNENENNGGQIDKNLYANDESFSGFMPLSVFPPLKPGKT